MGAHPSEWIWRYFANIYGENTGESNHWGNQHRLGQNSATVAPPFSGMHRNHKPFEKENINSDVTKTILLGLLCWTWCKSSRSGSSCQMWLGQRRHYRLRRWVDVSFFFCCVMLRPFQPTSLCILWSSLCLCSTPELTAQGRGLWHHRRIATNDVDVVFGGSLPSRDLFLTPSFTSFVL